MGFYKKESEKPGGLARRSFSEVGKKRAWKPEYKKFRVKSAIKSFRDLEVYKQTTQLAAEIFKMELPETIKNLPTAGRLEKAVSRNRSHVRVG